MNTIYILKGFDHDTKNNKKKSENVIDLVYLLGLTAAKKPFHPKILMTSFSWGEMSRIM